MTSIKEIKKNKRTPRKKGVKSEEGQYQHTAKGNTIISFYCPSKLLDVIDDRRGLVSRSVFLVSELSKTLGVELK